MSSRDKSPRRLVKKTSSTSSSPRVNIDNDADGEQEASTHSGIVPLLPIEHSHSDDENAFWNQDFINRPTVNWDSDINKFVCTHIYYKLSATNEFPIIIQNIDTLMKVSPHYAFTEHGQKLCVIRYLLSHHATNPGIVDLLRLFALKGSAGFGDPSHET